MINSCKKIDPVEQGENGFDGAESVMINGANGDVYVSGESTNQYSSVSLEDLFTIRYDAAGNVLDSVLGGSATYRDFVKEIGRDFANHLFLLSYDLSGNYMTSMYNLNLTIYGGIFMSAGYIHEPTEFSVDAASNKYFGIDEVNGFRIIKIDQNNLTVWSRNFQRTPTSTDEIKCIVADNNGNSYIAASTLEAGETDLWLLKVNSSGDTVWTKTWGIANGADDIPVKIVGISSPTSIVVFGNSIGSGNSSIVTLRFDTAGNLQSNYPLLYNTSNDVAVTGTKDSYGNLFVGGYSGSVGSEDFLTLKYRINNYAVSVIQVTSDSIAVTPAASSYQWYKGDTLLANETNQGIRLNSINYGNGNYSCKVIQYCCTYFSDTLAVVLSTVGIPELEYNTDLFSIISSPGENSVEIRININELGTLEVFDTFGKRIYLQTRHKFSDKETVQIPLTDCSGIYFIKLNIRTVSAIKKFGFIK